MVRTGILSPLKIYRNSLKLRHGIYSVQMRPKTTLTHLQEQKYITNKSKIPSLQQHKFFIKNDIVYPSSNGDNDHRERERLVNLGSMIDYLGVIIPEALNTTPDLERLNKDIRLRISPSIQSNVPIIKGQIKYITSLKATQLIFKNFILNSNTKLHISKLEVLSKEEHCSYGILRNSTKIIVHWKTCGDNCFHLKGGSSASRQHNKEQDLQNNDFFHNLINKYWSNINDERQNVRVLFGIFVFELNDMNDEILVHNVENLEVLDGKDIIDDDLMGVCS